MQAGTEDLSRYLQRHFCLPDNTKPVLSILYPVLTHLTKEATTDFGWISKKTMFGSLRLLPGAATAENLRILVFRETSKGQSRVLSGTPLPENRFPRHFLRRIA